MLRRLLQALLVMFCMTLIVFVGVYAIGNPADILVDPDAPPAQHARVVQSLGLDQPLWRQYLVFLGNAVSGDLGTSFVFKAPTVQILLQRLPATLELAFVALTLAVCIGIPLGVIAGLYAGRPTARVIQTFSVFGFSLPNFWIGMMLIMIFTVHLGWLPPTGRGATVNVLGIELSFLTLDGLRHLILPAVTLSLFKIALVIRLAAAGTREAMRSDYVLFAEAKGLRTHQIVIRHVLKNIMIPIVTVLGMELGSLIAFAVVTESVFAWPGIGKLLIESVYMLDRPMIVAYLILIVFVFVVINLVVDLLYMVLDPRVQAGGRA